LIPGGANKGGRMGVLSSVDMGRGIYIKEEGGYGGTGESKTVA